MLEDYGDGNGGVEQLDANADVGAACKLLVALGVKEVVDPDPEADDPHRIREDDKDVTERETWLLKIRAKYELAKQAGRVNGLWTDAVEQGLEAVTSDRFDAYVAEVIHQYGSLRNAPIQFADGTPAEVWRFVIAKPGRGSNGLSESDVRAVRNDLLQRIAKLDPPSVFWATDGAQINQLGGTEAAGSIVGAGIDGRGRLVARIAATSVENAEKLRARKGLDYWVKLRRNNIGIMNQGGHVPKGPHVERIALAEPGQKAGQFSSDYATWRTSFPRDEGEWVQFSE